LGKGFEAATVGQGWNALFPPEPVTEGLRQIDITDIVPNRYQPRQKFSQEALEALAASLKQHGLIQPITVCPESEGKFELIAGERRWRAAQLAGFSKIPAVIKELQNQERMEWALLENLQREDLNPIEKAQAYDRLLSDFSMTQEAIATRIGIDRSSIANFLRLLHLPKALWEDVADGRLTPGHAKAILSLEGEPARLQAATQIKQRALSVRQAESWVRQHKKEPERKQTAPVKTDPNKTDIEQQLRRALGTRVRLLDQGGKGRIEIEYYSPDDLSRLLEKLYEGSSRRL
jgi:ParB family chromosome partitioning protein